VFLLVEDVVLCAGHDTGVLNAAHGLADSDAGKDWIWREAFPVASTFWSTTERPDDRSELNINTLELVLGAHVVSSLVEQTAVPGSCDRDTSSVVRVSQCDNVPGYTYKKAELKSVSRTPSGESCMHRALKPSRGIEPTLPTHF
jgi:hypothetical protein